MRSEMKLEVKSDFFQDMQSIAEAAMLKKQRAEDAIKRKAVKKDFATIERTIKAAAKKGERKALVHINSLSFDDVFDKYQDFKPLNIRNYDVSHDVQFSW